MGTAGSNSEHKQYSDDASVASTATAAAALPRQSAKPRKSRKPRKSTKPEKYARGTRSYTMSHIRGKDTSIEVLVRSYLFRRGLRFRKNDKRYPGHPDVVLPKYRTIVFVNGCFWHMHEGCTKHSMPKSNVEFWTAKLLRNRARDAAQHAELEAAGWRVIVVWECELAKPVREERLGKLYEQIVGGNSTESNPKLLLVQ
ncbi:very short patch repair endonuclease [Bifidobacterium sp. LC6]|uniref:Very short patch repair endonuclease n=1 Tax=Bifidobacterium colobi TaxID=2809026 RepID=A0ABS5UTA5_9BIFI|nr:very short patch repair endonuclease [Bifidobacterium colobi]